MDAAKGSFFALTQTVELVYVFVYVECVCVGHLFVCLWVNLESNSKVCFTS